MKDFYNVQTKESAAIFKAITKGSTLKQLADTLSVSTTAIHKYGQKLSYGKLLEVSATLNKQIPSFNQVHNIAHTVKINEDTHAVYIYPDPNLALIVSHDKPPMVWNFTTNTQV